jgi:hypothetical protein
MIPDRNSCPKAGPKPCGWCGGHRGISKMSHFEPSFEYVTHFSSCRIRHFLLLLVEGSDASRFNFLAPSRHLENFGETVFIVLASHHDDPGSIPGSGPIYLH